MNPLNTIKGTIIAGVIIAIMVWATAGGMDPGALNI